MEKTLSLIGGNLEIKAGSTLYAQDGKINLVSVASAGEVVPSLSNTAQKLGTITLSHPPEIARSKIAENTEMANLDTSGMHGGKFFIQSWQFISKNGHIYDHLYLVDNRITAEARGKKPQDKGGNLTLKMPRIFTLDKSQLVASAYAGNGGNIDIMADYFIPSSDSTMNASSELGIDGDVYINVRQFYFVDYEPSKLLSLPTLLWSRCVLPTDELSTFRIRSRDGLPTSPEDLR